MPPRRASNNVVDPFVEEIAARTANRVLNALRPDLLLRAPPPVDVVEDVRPADAPTADARPKTVREFCVSNNISRSTYVKNRPLEMHIGRTIRITAEAEAEWRRARVAR